MERVRVNDTQKMVWDWAWAHTGETTTRLLDFSKKASCSARWTFIWTLSTSNEWNYIWHKVYHLQHISWFCFPLARLLCLASLLWYRGQLLWQKWILWAIFQFHNSAWGNHKSLQVCSWTWQRYFVAVFHYGRPRSKAWPSVQLDILRYPLSNAQHFVAQSYPN